MSASEKLKALMKDEGCDTNPIKDWGFRWYFGHRRSEKVFWGAILLTAACEVIGFGMMLGFWFTGVAR